MGAEATDIAGEKLTSDRTDEAPADIEAEEWISAQVDEAQYI